MGRRGDGEFYFIAYDEPGTHGRILVIKIWSSRKKVLDRYCVS